MTTRTKQCRKCLIVWAVNMFSPEKRNSDGLRSYCKQCINNANVAWRKKHPGYQTAKSKEWRENNRERHRELSYKWLKENPEKGRAHRLVWKAVRDGKLVRPKLCSRCKKVGIIQAHHKDYTKPLSVEWLCTTCHTTETR